MSGKKKKILAVVLLLAMVGVTVLLWQRLNPILVRLVTEPESVRKWVDDHGAYSRVVFVALVILQIIVAVIPGEPFEIAAGYAFGAWEGTALCILAGTLGSLLTFWLVRRFGMKLVRVFFSEEQIDSVKFLKSSPRRDMIFLVVYTLPGTPKDLLGYFAGLTDIRFPVWLMICSFGRLPSIVTSTIGGDALGTANYAASIAVFAVTLAISGLGLLLYQKIAKDRRG